jgi:hypothetical protein
MVNSVMSDHLELDSLPRSSSASISHEAYLSSALLLDPPTSNALLLVHCSVPATSTMRPLETRFPRDLLVCLSDMFRNSAQLSADSE